METMKLFPTLGRFFHLKVGRFSNGTSAMLSQPCTDPVFLEETGFTWPIKTLKKLEHYWRVNGCGSKKRNNVSAAFTKLIGTLSQVVNTRASLPRMMKNPPEQLNLEWLSLACTCSSRTMKPRRRQTWLGPTSRDEYLKEEKEEHHGHLTQKLLEKLQAYLTEKF